MEEDSRIVINIEEKQGGKNGVYWRVTWDDNKTDNIFNANWFPLLKESQRKEIPLHFTKEKTTKGNYWNIKTLEFLDTGESPGESVPAPKPEHKSSPETGMWWGQMGEMLRSGDIDITTPAGKAMKRAYYAEMLQVLGIPIPDSRLVQEAKKLGAVVERED